MMAHVPNWRENVQKPTKWRPCIVSSKVRNFKYITREKHVQYQTASGDNRFKFSQQAKMC